MCTFSSFSGKSSNAFTAPIYIYIPPCVIGAVDRAGDYALRMAYGLTHIHKKCKLLAKRLLAIGNVSMHACRCRIHSPVRPNILLKEVGSIKVLGSFYTSVLCSPSFRGPFWGDICSIIFQGAAAAFAYSYNKQA